MERGLTQRALAVRVGISTNHYQDIAHAQANPSTLVLLRLARALNVSLNDLFDVPSPDNRAVPVSDIQDLVSTHRRLSGVVARLAKVDEHAAVGERSDAVRNDLEADGLEAEIDRSNEDSRGRCD